MSPLLNRLTRALWPETAESWGLVLSIQDIIACRITRRTGAWQITEVSSKASPVSLYKGEPVVDLAVQLAPVIASVASGAVGRHTPVCIVVPDPAVSLNVIELETLPRTAAEREALARWHMERLWPPGTDFTCRIQDLGTADGKHLLLVLAMPRAWLDALTSACHLANVVPTVWQPAMICRFNRFQQQLLHDGRDGALFAFDVHSWSLLLWDGNGRVRYARSRWRDATAVSDAETIAVEVERTVRAFVHAGRDRQVVALHFIGEGNAADQVSALLDTRMQSACIRLSPLAGLEHDAGISLASPDAQLAITAALSCGK